MKMEKDADDVFSKLSQLPPVVFHTAFNKSQAKHLTLGDEVTWLKLLCTTIFQRFENVWKIYAGKNSTKQY